MSDAHAAALVLVMAAGTWVLRFLPFWVFRGEPPKYVMYLGRVLPAAIIGMLVVYCLKDVELAAPPHGLPERRHHRVVGALAAAAVVALQCWRRNALVSILCGTALYMLLTQLVFS